MHENDDVVTITSLLGNIDGSELAREISLKSKEKSNNSNKNSQAAKIEKNIDSCTAIVKLLKEELNSDRVGGEKLKERKEPPNISLDEVSKLYSLNEKQHVAFSIAGKASLNAYLLCLENKEEVSSLRMYIGGEGGTGKSQVI